MKTVHYIIAVLFILFSFGNTLWAQAPTGLQIDGGNTDSVNENRLVGAVVGRLISIDPNPTDTHSYTLVSGTGDTDNASFTISGNKLLTNAVFDFETKNSYSIRVRTTDTDSNTYEEALTITINDIGIETSTATTSVWNLNTPANYTLSPTISLDLSTGIGQLRTAFFTANDITGDTGNSRGTSFGDIDGDGDLDVYLANYDNEQNKLWINNGLGSFTASDVLGDTGFSEEAIFGDVDGDGDLDLYVVNVNQQNKLWINSGTGSFTAQDISGDLGNSTDAAFGDVDGDGDLDLYVVNRNEQNKLWINNGSGSFTASDVLGDTGFSEEAIFGDVDGDGDLDLYVANFGSQNKLWFNDGSGSFTANDISGDTGGSTAAAVGDVDGDGDLDIHVAIDGQNKLWLNDGSGTFTASDTSGDTGTSWGTTFGDVDGDGDLDIYVVNDGQNTLWINDGSGNFSSLDISGDNGDSRDASIGDVNGDGHLDIYVANAAGEQNKLWLNGYSTDKPYITANTAQSFTASLTGFSEVLSANNQGSVTYQISINNGTTWQYWNGTAWTTTTKTDGTETTSATVINTNINTLATTGGNFLWRAYLNSNGSQRVELDQVNISFIQTPPHSIRLGSGQNQSTAINSLYPVPLVAIVEDAGGNRLSGIAVSFTVPDSGPSLTFDSTGTTSQTVNTNTNGAAISSRMTPNSVVGSFHVTATVDGTSLTTSTLFENLAMDIVPPVITNSSIVGGSQSITATQVIFVKDFDEITNGITQDDFELSTNGTASGTITNFSQGLFGIRSRATITVGNLSGDGTISIRLKTATDITDVPGNGNGTNGHATQSVSSTIHNVQFSTIESQLSLSANNTLSIVDNGATSNNDLSLSVSGTLLRIEDTNNVLGGAGTFVTNHVRTLPLSSVVSITLNTQSGTDTVTLSGPLSFSGGGGLSIRGNTAVIQTASITLAYGALSYQVSRSITLASGGGIVATGSATIELLSTSSITLNASIRNTSTDPNNAIYLVSGWDGATSFSPTSFNGFSSVSSLTGTTPFGKNNAPIRLGDGSQTSSVTVGSRYGHTGLYGYSIVLTAGQGGSNRFVQLGFTTTDQGSSHTVSGSLILRAKSDLRLVGGGDSNPFNYAQVGHVGADTVSDTTVEATVTSPIDCAVGNEVYLSGGVLISNYAQLGHGGYNARGIYIGVYFLRTPEVSIKLIDSGGQGYSRLGNDD